MKTSSCAPLRARIHAGRRVAALLGAGIALAAGFYAGARAAAPSPSWPQDASDVKPDPTAVFGRLSNGLRYVVVPRRALRGQVSLRLRIAGGSLLEGEGQRGEAHFIEHMAFKGSTHVPDGDMVRLLERRGLAFGPDTNAHTEFDQTYYTLDLPRGDPDTVALALTLLRETASELLFSPAAVDSERGVVLSEERGRATPALAALKKRLAFLYAGQILPDRIPIGAPEVIRTVTSAELAAFYHATYRPDRAWLIVVGDIDAAAAEAGIRAKFSDWTATGPARAPPELGAPARRGPTSRLIVEPGVAATGSLVFMNPYDGSPDTEAARRRITLERLALAVVNRRLERAATTAQAPFVAASASVGNEGLSGRPTTITVSPRPGAWAPALALAAGVARRAADDGLSQAEVDFELRAGRAALAAAAAASLTDPPPRVANTILRVVDADRVYTSPAQDLARLESQTRDLNAQEVTATLRRLLTGQGPLLAYTAPEPPEGGPAALDHALQEVLAAKAPAVAAAPPPPVPWPYVDFGPRGTVASVRREPDLGVTFVTFANGVRLTVKEAHGRKDDVTVTVRVGTGRLGLDPGTPSVAWAAPALASGGVRKIGVEDMQRALVGRKVSAATGLADDAFVFQGATRKEDLILEMQVLTALITDAAYRPEPFERAMTALGAQLRQLNASPQGILTRDLPRLLAGGDQRWGLPPPSKIADVRVEDLKRLLQPILQSAPIEIVAVGDVDLAACVGAVAGTLGALPRRNAAGPPSPAGLSVAFPAPGGPPLVLRHEGRADQAVALEAWPTDGILTDPQRARAVNIAAEILKQRLYDRIRGVQSATYAPSVVSSPSPVFPRRGAVTALVETSPDKIAGVFKAFSEIASDLRTAGPTPDELVRAVQPKIEAVARAQQTAEYWLVWLAGAADDRRRLDLVRGMIPGYRTLTVEDVRRAAAYLVDDRGWRLKVLPR